MSWPPAPTSHCLARIAPRSNRNVPVIAVLAVRTGAGKSPISRFVARLLISAGLQARAHPPPDALWRPCRAAGTAFATLDDLDRYEATVEEREDYEPHLRRGLVVWAGVDYEAIVERQQKEAPTHHLGWRQQRFSLRCDRTLRSSWPIRFRPGHELSYHPGEVNLRRAQVVVINKVNSAPRERVPKVEANIRAVNPGAIDRAADSVISSGQRRPSRASGCWWWRTGPPSPTEGWPPGLGLRRARSTEPPKSSIPRPYAAGRWPGPTEVPHLGPILPALGYYEDQLRIWRPHLQRSGRPGGQRHALLPGEPDRRRQAACPGESTTMAEKPVNPRLRRSHHGLS